jgi:hypothetical protein
MNQQEENRKDPDRSPDHVSPMGASEGYVQIPRWVEQLRQEGEITEAQRRILYAIADETESWKRPWVSFSNSELAERVGVSRRWLIEMRNDLLDRGLLQRREYGQGYVYGLGDPSEPSREEIRQLVNDALEGEE